MQAARQTPFSERPDDPTPWGYYGDLLTAPDNHAEHERKRLAYYEDLFRIAHVEPQGLDVLEAGSGFGVGLIAVACLGARSVTGVELVGWQADWAKACVARLEPELGSRIHVETGNIVQLPAADGSLDLVLSLEAISHYLYYTPFLAEAARVLRPGGTLIVSDGNNALNATVRRNTEEMWAEHEADPRIAPRRVPEGHYDPWQLVEHRHRIALEAEPTLSDDDAWRLALNTSGMVRAEVADAARAYVETGTEPDRPYRPGTLIVHPEQEIVIERLFDPYELGDEIAGYGFDVSVRGHWGGAAGPAWRVANDALAALGRLSMRYARAFRIVARKR